MRWNKFLLDVLFFNCVGKINTLFPKLAFGLVENKSEMWDVSKLCVKQSSPPDCVRHRPGRNA